MGFVRNVFTVGAGGVIAQAMTVATMPVLSRLYSPLAFAGWAVFMSVAVIFASIATFRYELAVVLPESDEEGINLLAVSILAATAVSLSALFFIPFLGPRLLGDWLSAELRGWLWWLPVQIAAVGIFTSLNYWLVRSEEFTWYSLFQTLLPLATIVLQICAGLMKINDSSGLIVGSIGGQIIVAVTLILVFLKKTPANLIFSLSWSRMLKLSWKYRMYLFYMTPYTLMGSMRDRLVYVILGRFGTKAEAGFYNLSARLVNVPNSLLSSALRPVFFQRASGKNFRQLEELVDKVLKLLVFVIVPFWVLFLFHAQPLFALFFGEPWREAGLYAAILSVPALPLVLGNWLDRAFDVLGRQRLAFHLEALFAVASIAVLFAGIWFFQSTIVAVTMQASVITLYYCVWLVIVFKLSSFQLNKLYRLIYVGTGVGIAAALINWILFILFPGMASFYITTILFVVLVGMHLFRERKDIFAIGNLSKV